MEKRHQRADHHAASGFSGGDPSRTAPASSPQPTFRSENRRRCGPAQKPLVAYVASGAHQVGLVPYGEIPRRAKPRRPDASIRWAARVPHGVYAHASVGEIPVVCRLTGRGCGDGAGIPIARALCGGRQAAMWPLNGQRVAHAVCGPEWQPERRFIAWDPQRFILRD